MKACTKRLKGHSKTVSIAVALTMIFLSACGQKNGDNAPATKAHSSAVAPAGAKIVQIAAVGPLTGGIAHIGKDVLNGVQLALDEANAAKPTLGGKPVFFQLDSEDDAGDPKQAAAVAQRLCDKGVVAVIGHVQSGASIPASAVYDKCGIVQITPATSNPEYTQHGLRHVFRLIANDDQLIAGLAKAAIEQYGIKRVAIVDDRTAYGQGLAKVFTKVAKDDGVEVVAQEYTNDKAADFMGILTSIKGKKVDAILFGGLDAQAGPMLRQMEQLGLAKVHLIGGDAICTEKLPELAGGVPAVENVVCALGGAGVEQLAGGKEWMQRYNAKFPGEFQMYSPYAYAATQIILAAINQADSADSKHFLPKVAGTQMDSLIGKISFTPSGELTSPSISLYTFRAGKRTALAGFSH
jgi:branched-chain amino acid transport system substrate-binding protein